MSGQLLCGKTALVTGSSSGIGRAMAIGLSQAGARVLVHARGNQQGALQTARLIAGNEAALEPFMVDLADDNGPKTLFTTALRCQRKIDIWVNNAGADVLTGPALHWDFEKKLDRLWQVDVLATMRLSRLVGAHMMENGGGVIINMGWDQAECGMAGDSGELFAATKGAVMAFSKSLAQSLAPLVRVNCIAPGWIKTHWGQHASGYWNQRAIQESLMQRWGTPEDVAKVAVFLASDQASFLSGQTIMVNGGRRFQPYPDQTKPGVTENLAQDEHR